MNPQLGFRSNYRTNLVNLSHSAFLCLIFFSFITFCYSWTGRLTHTSQLNPYTNYKNNPPPSSIKNHHEFQTNAFEDLTNKVSGLKNVLQQKFGLSNELSTMDNPQVSAYEGDPSTPKAPQEPPEVSLSGEQTYPFQAEVSRVMDIIVNSLYTDRDIFLRELVSNSADALDKRRLKADPEEKIPKEAFGGIRIMPNKDLSTLTIEDDGIGMTAEELKTNLGTIAESGTAKFLQQIDTTGENNLIGQFGVGFYSSYLVSNKVEVFSRAYGQEAGPVYRWKSDSNGTYTIGRVENQELNDKFMKSGTRIVLHLKPECDDYLEDYKLKELLRKYSEFIRFPIQVWVERIEYERVPDDATIVDGKPGRYKTVTKKRNEWEVVNTQLPIWRRDQSTIKPEDYISFYKSTFKAYEDPLSYIHFKVEGQVEFTCLLFVPGTLPWELSRNMFDDESRGIRLYVKRVFINDKFSESIPRWLTFVRGVVDSDELSLNVGREYLQRSKALTVINKRIASKAIDMLKNLRNNKVRFEKFSENFGKYIKIGVVEDRDNQQELASLTTFKSTKEKSTTLDDYIQRMKKDQPAIYYISADSEQSAQNSPSLEKFNQLDYEVLYSLEPVDEFCLSSLMATKYKGIMIQDVNKHDVKIGENQTLSETSKTEGTTTETPQGDFEMLCNWIKTTFPDRVQEVKVSNRLVESPALLVQTDFGLSPSMQKYMRQQATSVGMNETEMFGTSLVSKPVLEINAQHPIIVNLEKMLKVDALRDRMKEIAAQLLDVVSIQGGYSIEDPSSFAKGIIKLMQNEAKHYLTNPSEKTPETNETLSEFAASKPSESCLLNSNTGSSVTDSPKEPVSKVTDTTMSSNKENEKVEQITKEEAQEVSNTLKDNEMGLKVAKEEFEGGSELVRSPSGPVETHTLNLV
ncbi:Hsp90 family protein [Theileria parva strain Muguga]|uniref:Heat shock protein 90, putative n=1 Tax=Theileria parva TaxID=5875 RepID=Q4N1T4_THEPA|nr:Hsp90 family protein [Theileria parva strain Muguga]EAN31998.1 Hsp90 family protein [Theileria parva strain Muguga]|eukprot:XP_764281.1 heat shock protein 90 [Theileria parva strain Muguga]